MASKESLEKAGGFLKEAKMNPVNKDPKLGQNTLIEFHLRTSDWPIHCKRASVQGLGTKLNLMTAVMSRVLGFFVALGMVRSYLYKKREEGLWGPQNQGVSQVVVIALLFSYCWVKELTCAVMLLELHGNTV